MINQKLRTTLFILFVFFLSNVKGQQNLPFVDEKNVHFGFTLGLNFMDFAVIPTDVKENVSTTSIIPGFTVGAITDIRLNRYFNFRFIPQLMLNQRNLTYADNSTADLLSVPLYLPFYVKYSSERVNNYRPYIIGGAGVWIDWGRNKDKTVLLKPFDSLIEIGAGVDIYFRFFKLAPELKFAFGLNNMLTPMDERDAGALLNPNTIKQTNSIQKLTTRMISLTFNFE